jgi:hypothetical protein
VHWDARLASKLGKPDDARMTSNMGRREYDLYLIFLYSKLVHSYYSLGW